MCWPVGLFGANLLENSSFECGDLRGWSYGAYGNNWPFPFAFSTNAYDGNNGVTMETTADKQIVFVSRIYRLKPATAYTASMYARGRYISDHLYASPRLTIQNSQYGCDTYHTNCIPPDTEWHRYGLTFTTTNDADCAYIVRIEHNGQGATSGNYVDLDAFQLEEGTTASAYAPISVVEIGCNLNRSYPGHIWYSDEQPSIPIVGRNSGASDTTIALKWKVYNSRNVVCASGSAPLEIAARSGSTNNISISILPTGAYRFWGYVDGVTGSQIECVFGVVPRPVSLTDRTNSAFGIETYPSAWYLGASQRLGFHWNRHLSVFPFGRWSDAEPTLNTWVEWTNEVALERTFDIEPLGQLGAGQSHNNLPAYAQDPTQDNWPNNILWSNYCYKLVTDYSPYCKYWELWNEEAGITWFTNILMWGTPAVKSAQPTAVVVAPADFYYNTVSNVLGVIGTNLFDVWSTHMYPLNESYQTITSQAMSRWWYAGWNTETGLRNDTFHALALWEKNLFSDSNALRPDGGGYTRHWSYRLPYQLHNLWGSLQGQIKKYFYYDGRNTGGNNGYIAFSIFDYDNVVNPMGIVHAVAANMMDGGTGLGIVNLSSKVDAYGWSRSNVVTFALFSTNYLTTNACEKLAVISSLPTTRFIDEYGVETSGVGMFGREPIFVHGASGVSSNDLAISLNIYSTNDTDPPQLAFTTVPTSADDTWFTWRWTAVDDTCIDAREHVHPNAILYRYKLTPNDSEFSEWTNKSWVTYSNMTPGSVMIVQAKDVAGNQSQKEFPEIAISNSTTATVGFLRSAP